MRRKEYLDYILLDYLTAPEGPQKDRAADVVAREYDYLVINTVSRFTRIPYGTSSEDLEQAGRISLYNALIHYNPYAKAAFQTYAIASIRTGVSRAIRDASWYKAGAINERSINRAKADLVCELGRDPSDEEIADQMGVTSKRYNDMVASCAHNRPFYMNQPSSEHPVDGMEETCLSDVLPDQVEDICDQVVRKQQVEFLVQIAERLPSPQKEIALLLFQGYSSKDIGEITGYSVSRVASLIYTVRAKMYSAVMRCGKEDLFEEWTSGQFKVGRIRSRKRVPKFPLVA